MNELIYHSQRITDVIGAKIKNFFYRAFKHPSQRLKTFYILTVVGILCYIYSWITNDFTVPLSGDYYLQEMTFLFNGYDDWHHFFETGQWRQWDRSVFLGIDNVGGNSFYYLFDPFFLILLPFPRDWLLTLQGLMFVPKMVIGGMLFYWYLGEFEMSPKVRTIGALAYGFTGYAFSYLWFHFIDSVAFFPLILLGVERLLRRQDPRVLLIGYLVNAMTSYFFFVVFMFGGFFYWCFRYLQDIFRRKKGENWAILGCSFVAFLVSVFLGLFVLLPGMVVATSMPRVTSSDTWLNNLLSAEGLLEKLKALLNYNWNYSSLTPHAFSLVTPLFNFLFMPNSCYSGNIYAVNFYDNFNASLYATTPLLLMFFVGIIYSFKEKKISHIIGFILNLILIFTPIGFFLFSGFSVGYARYFIVPTAWLITFDCITIQKRRSIPRTYLDIAFVMVMFLDIVSCFLDIWFINKFSSWNSSDWEYRLIEIPISMLWVFICYMAMRPFFHKKKFNAVVTGLMCLDIVAMGNITILFWGTVDLNTMAGGQENIAEETKIVSMLKESEGGEDYYRIFNPTADRGDINISLREGYTGLGAFHSVYPFDAQDFIDRSRIAYTHGNWSMGIHNRRYNLESFLGTKYYLVPKVDPTTFKANTVPTSDYDIPLGYVNILDLTEEEKEELGVEYSQELLDFLASDSCDKSVYVNKYFVDLGFSYDTVINTSWLSYGSSNGGWGRYEDVNEYPLLRYAMLDDEDFATFEESGDFNAGTFTVNGHTVTMNTSATTSSQSNQFYNALVSSAYYQEGTTAPIEYLSTSNGRLDVTVYSANWPATESNPSGEYLYCTVDGENVYSTSDPNFETGVAEFREENPLLYANGIYPGDTEYDSIYDEDGVRHKVLYYSKVVYTPMKNGQPTTIGSELDPDDPNDGVYISIQDTNYIEWRLFDEDGVLISDGLHSYAEYKQAHGYYADRPVSKIVGIILTGSKSSPVTLQTPQVYVQRHSDYVSAMETLKTYQPTITSRTDDKITFTTDYEEDRFMVLNYPKQNGWTVTKKVTASDGTVTYENVDLYKAQGGFIGFVAESGEQEYILEYESPYFKLGGMATLAGAFITLCFLAFYGHRDRMKGKPDLISLQYVTEKTIKKMTWEYEDCER